MKKELANASQEALGKAVVERQGASGELKPNNFSLLEAPRRHPMFFFRPQAATKSDLKSSWCPLGAHLAARGTPKGYGQRYGSEN